MRVFVLATMLLASSSLYPSVAQEQGKTPLVAPPQTVPAQTDPNASQQGDQRTDRDQSVDDRETGRDWRPRRGDGDRLGREDRVDPDGRMHRDREADRDREMDRGRYGDRGDRGRDRPDRDRDYKNYDDDDRPRRRVKVCVEYENGDEYCRYKGR